MRSTLHLKNQKNPDLIFGTRAVLEAIISGKAINKVFLKNKIDNTLVRDLKKVMTEYQVFYQYVVEEKIERLAPGKNHQGVVALVSPAEYYELDLLLPALFEAGKNPLFVILEGITDVRNFGAIARSVATLGADAIILPLKNSVSITSDAIKTSAGALHQVKTCRVKNLLEAVIFLQNSGVQVIACSEKANTNVNEVDFTVPTALIFGSEEDGIASEILKKSNQIAKIPFLEESGIYSLNVSAAAAIVLYEAQQQRTKNLLSAK